VCIEPDLSVRATHRGKPKGVINIRPGFEPVPQDLFEIFCELIEVILINYVIFFLVKKGEDIFREVF
jgi:hypothetical protein